MSQLYELSVVGRSHLVNDGNGKTWEETGRGTAGRSAARVGKKGTRAMNDRQRDMRRLYQRGGAGTRSAPRTSRGQRQDMHEETTNMIMTSDAQAQAARRCTDADSQGYLLLSAAPLKPARLSERQLAALVAGARLAHEHGGPGLVPEAQLAALRAQFDDDVRGTSHDVSDRPAAPHLGLQAAITNRLALVGLNLPVSSEVSRIHRDQRH